MPDSAGKLPQVLVVDDNQDNANIIRDYLQSRGYPIAVAYGGDEALSLFSELRPEIVLLDVMMPGLNGYDVCRRLRAVEKFNDLAIVMLTAPDRPPDITSFLAGADLAIRKPFEESKLLSILRTAIQLKKN